MYGHPLGPMGAAEPPHGAQGGGRSHPPKGVAEATPSGYWGWLGHPRGPHGVAETTLLHHPALPFGLLYLVTLQT
jgi:hypothetical protein